MPVVDIGGVRGSGRFLAQEHLWELLHASPGGRGAHSSHSTGYRDGPGFGPVPTSVWPLYQCLLRLLDSMGISHTKVRNAPDWNHQSFADDLSLYTENMNDIDVLHKLEQKFQDWSGLKISTNKSIFHRRPIRTRGQKRPKDGEC